VVIRGANIEFAGGGKPEAALQPVKGPGVDSRPLPAWGVYARNVEQVTLEDVRLSLANEDLRPAVMADGVHHLKLDSVKLPQIPGVAQQIITTNVSKFDLR